MKFGGRGPENVTMLIATFVTVKGIYVHKLLNIREIFGDIKSTSTSIARSARRMETRASVVGSPEVSGSIPRPVFVLRERSCP